VTSVLEVDEDGHRAVFGFDEMLKFHGPLAPGGVAHAFKVMERAFPILAPEGRVERREITIETAFGGPGARDGFEMVTRAVSEGRYTVDPRLARPERGRTLERYVFKVSNRGRSVTLIIRPGYVRDEYISLSGQADRSPEQEDRLAVLKLEMAARIMSAPAVDVYDVVDEDLR
jgi:hypothetical protein